MLEDIALKFVSQSEGASQAIAYGLLFLGAIGSGITNKSNAELARAPYFAYSSLIVLLVSALQFIWLQTPSALAGGYLWVLMVVSIASTIVGGFYFGNIAIARSRDAFGHGRMAALAFIPFANFWLLLKPSKKMISANRTPTIPLLTGAMGILLGLAMLIAMAGVNVYIELEGNRLVKRGQTKPAIQQASIDGLVRSLGVEKTLRLMASANNAPISVDEVTTLARIEADGMQLRRTYVVSIAIDGISEEFRASIINGLCAHIPFIPLLRAGATIHEVYIKTDGSSVGEVLVARDTCGL
jgi:hypothetical protein